MRRIFNLRDDELGEDPRAARDGHRFRRTQLTLVHDSKLTGLSVYELPPGEAAWAYHYELNREEWLIVVSGEVVLRSPTGERTLPAGDVVCFPPGESGGARGAERVCEHRAVRDAVVVRLAGLRRHPARQQYGADRRPRVPADRAARRGARVLGG